MKSASPELIALLNSGGPYLMADLYTFSLVNGAVLRYTDWDVDIAYGGQVFSASGPLIERGRVRVVIGVEVDTLDMTIYADQAKLIGSTPWMQAVAGGLLDGATVKLERVFMAAPPAPVGGFVHFSGRVANVQLSRIGAQITVNSDLELLNVQMPRNLYQPTCQHTLYDADCGLARSACATSAKVTAGSTATTIACNLTAAANAYVLGYLEFTSGALTGVKRSIRASAPGSVQILNPLPLIPAAGDAFTVYLGCDKTQAMCTVRFNNKASFRAFPYIPVPETAL